jgi:hypothetical protein
MNWIIRFYLRNDTMQKWIELIRFVVVLGLIVAGALFCLRVYIDSL